MAQLCGHVPPSGFSYVDCESWTQRRSILGCPPFQVVLLDQLLVDRVCKKRYLVPLPRKEKPLPSSLRLSQLCVTPASSTCGLHCGRALGYSMFQSREGRNPTRSPLGGLFPPWVGQWRGLLVVTIVGRGLPVTSVRGDLAEPSRHYTSVFHPPFFLSTTDVSSPGAQGCAAVSHPGAGSTLRRSPTASSGVVASVPLGAVCFRKVGPSD